MVPPGFFPNLPDEVRQMWLDPIAEQYGWPFQSLTDSTDDTKWRYVLPKMSLREFAELRWKLERVSLTAHPFRPGSLDGVQGLLQQHVLGLDTLYANVLNSKERMGACASFIREHGDLPAPIVLISSGGVYDLLDGNHRLAALLSEGIPPDYKVPAWIGFHDNGVG